MLITIDTEKDLSAQDKALLAAIIGEGDPAGTTVTPTPAPAKKAAAKKTAAAKPAPTPEPDEDTDDGDAAPTKEDALARASEVMDTEGGVGMVKAALDAVKAAKVGQLKPAQVQPFLDALEAAVADSDSPL